MKKKEKTKIKINYSRIITLIFAIGLIMAGIYFISLNLNIGIIIGTIMIILGLTFAILVIVKLIKKKK